MTVRIVTSMSKAGHKAYGHMFPKNQSDWPKDHTVTVYSEDDLGSSLASCRSMPAELQTFIAHAPDWGNGRTPRKPWRSREIAAGYSFRTDGIRFAPKVFALAKEYAVAEPGDLVVWLDADVTMIRRPPDGFLRACCPEPAVLSRLCRPASWTETGFLAFRKGSADSVIRHWLSLYRYNGLWRLEQQHDAFAFDVALARAQDAQEEKPLLIHNLAIGIRHVWHDSPLALYLDHLKGDRKALGRSPESRTYAE